MSPLVIRSRRQGSRCAILAGVVALAGLPLGAEPPQAPPATTGLSHFRIASSRSTLRFDADATVQKIHGVTHDIRGEAVFDPEALSRQAEVSFEVEASSLDTGNRVRDRRMREDYLDTRRFPSIAFRSSKIEAIAPTLRPGEDQELIVQGILSLHGVDRPMKFPAKAARKGDELQVTGETTLRLTDFSIPLPRFLLFFRAQDEIKVMFNLVAVADPGRGKPDQP